MFASIVLDPLDILCSRGSVPSRMMRRRRSSTFNLAFASEKDSIGPIPISRRLRVIGLVRRKIQLRAMQLGLLVNWRYSPLFSGTAWYPGLITKGTPRAVKEGLWGLLTPCLSSRLTLNLPHHHTHQLIVDLSILKWVRLERSYPVSHVLNEFDGQW